MNEKSHVGMSLCFFCGEPKEVLLDRRLKNTLPRQAVYNHEPCDKCHEFMKQGVIVIEYDESRSTFQPGEQPELYRTGAMHVLTDDAIARMRDQHETGSDVWNTFARALEMRAIFLPDVVCRHIGIPLPEGE